MPSGARTRNPGDMERGLELALARLRDERGMSQEELAKAAGISRSLTSEILSGKGSLTMTEFHLMCRKLGVTMGEVIALGAAMTEDAPTPRVVDGTGRRTG